LSGAKGEDQCAACHGNDHRGTRLSKTPVDRVFDFRGFDGKKLKKAGFKTKVVKVAAGTPIGCDTCHSLETSFIGSPGH
jgi:RecJ-like exonuclease